jgi:catecholate siderophore receptor
VEGFEEEVSGRLTQSWQLMGGYALLNSRLTESVYYPAAVGSRLANVPRNTFNLWSTYDLPWHFQFGAGTNFVDSRSASSTVPIDPITGLVKQVPSYWVFNAMLKYRISERVNVQVNVNNLADRYYYDEIHPAHIVPGEARNALVGLNFRF